ncbi:MAG: hypothetical protein IJW13_03980 [Clostridia bacterium]|nr:hypothetical protein [Clostridia bacterium]
MNDWIKSITFITIIGYVAYLLIPSGKTKKILTFVLSAALLLSLIMPLSNTIKNLENYEYYFEVEQNYANFFKNCKFDYYLTVAKSKLKLKGIQLKNANFSFNDNNGQYTLEKIIINLNDLGIIEGYEHINIPLVVTQTLSELFSINAECIILI